MMVFRRFIFSAFILSLLCLTFASSAIRRHGSDADPNTDVVDVLATKDAVGGLGEDQVKSNDGASRQRRSCNYDPVYGQVCTAPRCTEYDYYGNCLSTVGKKKRDIDEPNSEDPISEIVDSAAGYGRRKRDIRVPSSGAESLGEDNMYVEASRDADEDSFEDSTEDQVGTNGGPSRQKRSCRRGNRCKRNIPYETTDRDSLGEDEDNAHVVYVAASRDADEDFFEDSAEDQVGTNGGPSRQKRSCRRGNRCKRDYETTDKDSLGEDEKGRSEADVVYVAASRDADEDSFVDNAEDQVGTNGGPLRQKRSCRRGNRCKRDYETTDKDSLGEDEAGISEADAHVVHVAASRDADEDSFEDNAEDQVGTNGGPSRQKRSCRRGNRCKRDYETTDKDSLGEDEAGRSEADVVYVEASRDADEDFFEDSAEDQVGTNGGASRQKRSCRRGNRCKRNYETTDKDSLGEDEAGRSEADDHLVYVAASRYDDEDSFEDSAEDQVGTNGGPSRQKRSCRRGNRCKRDYETTDKDSLGEDEAISIESSEEAIIDADNGLNEYQASRHEGLTRSDEAKTLTEERFGRDKRSLSYDRSSSSYKFSSDIPSSSSSSSSSGIPLYPGLGDTSSRLSSSSSTRLSPSYQSTDDIALSSYSRSSADGCRLVWVHEQKCDEGYEQQCRDELEDRCETVNNKVCKTETERECRTENVQDCSTEYEEQCDTKYKEDCKTEYERKCTTSYEKECRTEREQKCDTEHKQECKTDYQRECSTSYEMECETVQDSKCVTEYKEECSAKNSKVCKTLHVEECHTEHEQKCQTEYSKVCTPKTEKKCSTKFEKSCKKGRACKDSGHRTYKQVSRPSSSSFPDDAVDCDWVDSEDCDEIPVEQCHNVITEDCHDVPLKKCFSVPVEKCRSVPKESCSYIPLKSCSQIPHQRCFNKPREVCRSVPKEQCTDEPKTTCTNVPQKSCYDVAVEKCKHVPKEKCHNVPERKCNQVPEKKCRNVPKLNCRSVPREKCEDQPRTTCTNVPEVKCDHKVVNKCKQVPTKNNCRAEKVSKRICDGELK